MATTFNYNKTQKGPCEIWANLAIPTAGNRLTLTSGKPDAIENPNRILLGLTEKGATSQWQMETEDEFFDEFPEPLGTYATQRMFRISTELSQVFDIDALEYITKGIGTKITGVNYEGITIGEAAIAFGSVAVISPLRSDPTKYSVSHIYQAFAKIDMSLVHSRGERMKAPVTFEGYGITSRAATDRIGAFWWQK